MAILHPAGGKLDIYPAYWGGEPWGNKYLGFDKVLASVDKISQVFNKAITGYDKICLFTIFMPA